MAFSRAPATDGPSGLPIPTAFRALGIAGLAIAVAAGVFPTWVYAVTHPDFSIFHTYMSDIGDTEGWPQILFNSITLLGAPIRFLIILLLALRLHELGGRPRLLTAITVVGFLSMSGTIFMTAVPFSVEPNVHRAGIPLYFFGTVILQILIGVQELRILRLPRLLAALCLLVVLVFLIFFFLYVQLERGVVDRHTPVIWEWLCLLSSVVWLAGHVVVLGDGSERFLRPKRLGTRPEKNE